MPTVFKQNGFRFFFYPNEGNPREPIHVHVMKGNAEAKIWLDPSVGIDRAIGFGPRDLRRLLNLVELGRSEIEAAWHDHFRNARDI